MKQFLFILIDSTVLLVTTGEKDHSKLLLTLSKNVKQRLKA